MQAQAKVKIMVRRKIPNELLLEDVDEDGNVRAPLKALVSVSFTIHPDMLEAIDFLRGSGEPGARPRSQQLCLMLEEAMNSWGFSPLDAWTEHVQPNIGFPEDKNNVVVIDFKKLPTAPS